jgi:ATP-dependent DNA helicase RecG
MAEQTDIQSNALSGCVSAEKQSIQTGSEADIDLTAVRNYLSRLGRAEDGQAPPVTEEELRGLRVLTETDGVLQPTLYGVMAFGKEPQHFRRTMSFRVNCVAYAGRDRASDVLLVGEANGRLDEQVQRALGWIHVLGWRERYSGLIREDIPLIPEKALREALVNAVVHRDYAITGSKVLLEVFADRIAITSPGTLPNQSRRAFQARDSKKKSAGGRFYHTVDSVPAGGHPRSRNELMANYMLVMGAMEQRGRGWPVMRRAMREFNGTDAELTQDEGGKFVRVTLRLQGGEAPDEK